MKLINLNSTIAKENFYHLVKIIETKAKLDGLQIAMDLKDGTIHYKTNFYNHRNFSNLCLLCKVQKGKTLLKNIRLDLNI